MCHSEENNFCFVPYIVCYILANLIYLLPASISVLTRLVLAFTTRQYKPLIHIYKHAFCHMIILIESLMEIPRQ